MLLRRMHTIRHRTNSKNARRFLSHESLEHRRLLAADMPDSISGFVYVDRDGGGSLSDFDSRLENVRVELLHRTIDTVDDTAITSDTLVAEVVTDENGAYCFDGLDPTLTYVVRQPEQNVAGRELAEVTGPATSLLIQNIDLFQSSQFASDLTTIDVGSTPFTSFVTDEGEVIGAERDMSAEAIEGNVSVSVGGGRFSFNADNGSIGKFTVQWDGIDGERANALRLGGVDLSHGLENVGIYLRGIAELPNIGVVLRLYSGQGEAGSIRQGLPTDNEGTVFWSFAEAFQPGLDARSVNAIELEIDTSPLSAPGYVTSIGAIAPRNFNIGNALTADLEIVKTDNQAVAVPGADVQYVITARNNGPDEVIGVSVTDTFSELFTSVSYQSEGFDGATGNTTDGTGNIQDTLSLPAGSNVTYLISATLSPEVLGEVVNVATISAENLIDPDESNNSSTDTDELEPQFSIRLEGQDDVATVLAGDAVSYEFTVTNDGPSLARRVRLTSTVSELLENVSFSSDTTEGVTGNSLSGEGNFQDELTIAPSTSLTYRISGTVVEAASGEVMTSVVAETLVEGPDGDIVADTQTATDTNVIQQSADLSVSQTNNTDLLIPGEPVTYTIVVQNNGTENVAGVLITDTFPAELEDVTYTSEVTSGTVEGNTTDGAGDINDAVSMSGGASITYTVMATVSARATDVLVNEVTVGGEGLFELTPEDNTATESDVVQPLGDLSVQATVSTERVVPGTPITYEFRITKTGPSTADGVTISIALPDSISAVNYTSQAMGGAAGNGSGEGVPNEQLVLPGESEVIYSVTGFLSPDAEGELATTAIVIAPEGFLETDTLNNEVSVTVSPTAEHDIEVTQSTADEFANLGADVSFVVTVRNNGPSRARGIPFTDMFPTSLENVQVTAVARDGATGASDTVGNISQTLELPVGASVAYAVNARVRTVGTTEIRNTASVETPDGSTDPINENNSATTTIDVSTGVATRQVAVGDLNGDGLDDAAVVHEYSGMPNDTQGSVVILINDGNGNLNFRSRIAAGDRPQSVAIGDFDNNGSQDLVVARVGYTANSASNNLLVLFNDGDGSFSQRRIVRAGNGPIFVTTGDLDNDGDTDIAAANFRSNTVSIVRSLGAGSFAPAIEFATGHQPVSLAIGKLNSDRFNDLAVANSGDGTVSLFPGPFRGGKQPFAKLTAARQPSAVIARDIDSDGVDDIAVTDFDADVAVLYYGRGNGTFATPGSNARLRLPSESRAQSLIASDFDGDGNIDVAVAQTGLSGVAIFYSSGNRNFSAPESIAVKPGPQSLAVISDMLIATSFVRPGRANVYSLGEPDQADEVSSRVEADDAQADSQQQPDVDLTETIDESNQGSNEVSEAIIEDVSATRRKSHFFAIVDDTYSIDRVDQLLDVTSNDWFVDTESASISVERLRKTVGEVSVVNGVVKYVAPNGFSGSDAFVYTVVDDLGNRGSARVTIHVSEIVTSAPAAQSSTREAAAQSVQPQRIDEPVTISPLRNVVPVSITPMPTAPTASIRPQFMVIDDRFTTNKTQMEFNLLANDRVALKQIWLEHQTGPGNVVLNDDGTLEFVSTGGPGDRTVLVYSVEDESGKIGSARVEILIVDANSNN
ncbi:MAG: DUF11 domain-containing protein [Planctomycetales bacterium]|nr:DUF11 domain-containing protein [Planctomycetales bacterium]